MKPTEPNEQHPFRFGKNNYFDGQSKHGAAKPSKNVEMAQRAAWYAVALSCLIEGPCALS
jgi:hypothetical protein